MAGNPPFRTERPDSEPICDERRLTCAVIGSKDTSTGTVQLVIDGGAPITLTLENGTATLVTQTLSVGSHTVVATYSGDANYAGTTASLSGGQTIVASAGTPGGGGGTGRLPSTGGEPFRGVETALLLVAGGVACLGVRRASIIAAAPSRRRR